MRSRRLGKTWLKVLLGCGCLAALVTVVVTLVGGYFAYRAASSSFMLDPARVEALAQRESPGSKAPDGFQGRFGMDFSKLQIAFFADSKNRMLGLMSMRMDENLELTHDEVLAQMEEGMANSDQERSSRKKVLKKEEYEATSQGQRLAGLRRLIEDDGERKWEYVVFGKCPRRAQTVLLIIGHSPEADTSDDFVRSYVETVKMLPWAE